MFVKFNLHIRTYTYIQVASVLQYIRTHLYIYMQVPQCTRLHNCYIALQPFIISALVVYMGVCMQLGDVYMGRYIAGIGMQS